MLVRALSRDYIYPILNPNRWRKKKKKRRRKEEEEEEQPTHHNISLEYSSRNKQ